VICIPGGRRRSRDTRSAVPFARYLAKAELDAAPPARDYLGETTTTFPWWGNDRVGDCTIAALYDRRVLLAALTGEPFASTTAAALADYTAIGGFDGTPGDPTDHGLEPINVLAHAQAVGIAGSKIAGYARLNFDDQGEMRAALNLFCCVYAGAGLPKNADEQGYLWDMPPIAQRTELDAPDPDRGHMFLIGGYDRLGWSIVTWASSKYRASNAWVEECVDEAYVIIDDALVRGDRPAPNGFDLERLRFDLAAL